MLRSRWWLRGLTLAVAALLGWGVATRVDLAPRVEADFFFAPGDPQLRESRALAARYPGGGAADAVIVRAAAPDTDSKAYTDRVEGLSRALAELPGVAAVYSVADQDRTSPFWGRVLAPAGSFATNLIATLDAEPAEAGGVAETGRADEGSGEAADASGLVRRIEAVLAEHEGRDFRLLASGTPVVVELVRRGLARDLAVFSTAALVLFGLVAMVLYRDARIVAGTLLSCLCACGGTLLAARALGIGIGLLTANIVTIVFVLTLSHTVFIVANWRQGGGAARALARTIRPSTWCMATTAAGFMSLWATSAQPLRELGTAGALGTLAALAGAFGVLPAWLGADAHPGTEGVADGATGFGRWLARWRRRLARRTPLAKPGLSPKARPALSALPWVLGVAALGGMASGVLRLNTDPSLLSYFDPEGPIRQGLEIVDHEGGSSPLLLAVRAASGERLDTREGYERMWQFQDSLEADPATGTVLSPAPLIAHARTFPLAGFLPVSVLADLLDRPELGAAGRGFVSEDRTEVLYAARMKEGDRTESRESAVVRLTAHAAAAGLAVDATGGLYELQGRLGTLIASSLKVGLGGLLALFLLVGAGVARGVGAALAMLACLLAVPSMVLGAFGHAGVAVDIVTSPAATVALAMGVDSMIHLANRVRAIDGGAARAGGSWRAARAELATPVATACAIVCTGFGVFAFSDFPPTRRFGLSVALGTVVAATAALGALPRLMSRKRTG